MKFISTRIGELLRRTLDILVASISLLLLSPVYVFLSFLIRKDTPGPIMYHGERVGKNGRIFSILKFRTMYDDPDSFAGPPVTGQGDPRITPVGKWLRDTKLNELPQLWNVLKGDMSLVGPRPEDPEIVKDWPENVRKVILSVRPGITSPASVVYRDEEEQLNNGSVMEEYLRSILPSKLRLDMLYVKNRSLISDLDVIFWTFMVLVPRARKVRVPEPQLYWGPFARFLSHDLRWFILDALVSLVSVTIVAVFWRSVEPLNIGWAWAPIVALVISFIFSFSNALLGVQRTFWRKARPSDALTLAVSTGVSVAILWLADLFLVTPRVIPPGLYPVTGILALSGFIMVRYRARILTGMAAPWLNVRRGGLVVGEKVLVIGAGELSEFAIWLASKGELAQVLHIVGLVDDDPKKLGMRIGGVKTIGTTADIPQLVEKFDVGLIMFAISNIESEDKNRIINHCKDLDVRFVMLPNVVQMMRDYFNFGPEDAETLRDETNFISRDLVALWLEQIAEHIDRGEIFAAQEMIERLQQESFQEHSAPSRVLR